MKDYLTTDTKRNLIYQLANGCGYFGLVSTMLRLNSDSFPSTTEFLASAVPIGTMMLIYTGYEISDLVRGAKRDMAREKECRSRLENVE